MQPTKAPFVQQVKDALSRLHDHAYLQLHPLATMLAPDHRSLRELLCQEIERLALSPRQCRREHQKGLHALADRLYQQLGPHTPTAPPSGSPTDRIPAEDFAPACGALETEVERLGAAGEKVGETAVGDVLPGVFDTLADFAAQLGIHMQMRLVPDLPPVHVERVVLRQVLLNTLAHLMDRSAGGAITTSVTHGDGSVVVQMQGESAGTVERTPDDERLTVVEQLLHMRHGTLIRGDDRVTLRLPAQQPSAVLVVDDNPDVIRLFRRYLSGTTHELLGATSSEEALRLAQQARPQAIVLDVMMPDRDGWEILQFLQNQPDTRRIPVIICSVLQEQSLARTLGAAHFLAKPVTRQTLLAALSTVLGSAN